MEERMKQGRFSTYSPTASLFFFFLLFIGGFLITGLLAYLPLLYFHIPADFLTGQDIKPNSNIVSYILLSTVIQNVFLFFLPAILYAYLFDSPTDYGLLNPQKNKLISFLLIPLLWFLVVPFISFTGFLNENMVLPHALAKFEAFIKGSEAQQDKIIAWMLADHSLIGISKDIFCMALLPAIGEEFIFRGAFQKVLIRLLKSPHAAIILGAILFSAFHLQFYGFLPRMFLGLILGYLFYWSRSIWPGVLFHFLNNGIEIILNAYYSTSAGRAIPKWIDKPGIFLAITSLFLASFVFWYIYKIFLKARMTGNV